MPKQVAETVQHSSGRCRLFQILQINITTETKCQVLKKSSKLYFVTTFTVLILFSLLHFLCKCKFFIFYWLLLFLISYHCKLNPALMGCKYISVCYKLTMKIVLLDLCLQWELYTYSYFLCIDLSQVDLHLLSSPNFTEKRQMKY